MSAGCLVVRSWMSSLAGHVWDGGEEKELKSEHCLGRGPNDCHT